MVVLSCLGFAQPDFAQAKALNYLTSDMIPPGTAVPTPPPLGSPAERHEIDLVLGFQATRTPADCQRGGFEANLSFASLYGAPYGPLTPQQIQNLTPFFNRVGSDAQFFYSQEKAFWKRPRPSDEDPRVQPCVNALGGFSYPSGHAVVSEIFADILSAMDPGHAPMYHARAEQIGMDRAVVGVHHPIDVFAGQVLGKKVFEALMNSPQFQQDLRGTPHFFGFRH